MNNITAKICAFVRMYHNNESNVKIYSDNYAKYILSKEEYNSIIDNMCNGIKFFNPNFEGNKSQKISFIVNNQLGPSVLGRAAFNKRALENAINIGCKQYLLYASGYDTSAIGVGIKAFEIDRAEMIDDKRNRLKNNNINIQNIEYIKSDFTKDNWILNVLKSSYNPRLLSFNSLLGISYYLTKEEFNNMLKQISDIISNGSSILFDFQTDEYSRETTINEQLASEAKEKMKAKYSYNEIEKILSDNDLLVYEY